MSAEFIGPLDPAAQQHCEQAARGDRIAAISEPASVIVQRRLASIAELNRMAALMLLTGDVDTAHTIAASAVAEGRALLEFQASTPPHCLDCFVYGHPCAAHAARCRGSDSQWHRFGK
jgi:hypothetical protein